MYEEQIVKIQRTILKMEELYSTVFNDIPNAVAFYRSNLSATSEEVAKLCDDAHTLRQQRMTEYIEDIRCLKVALKVYQQHSDVIHAKGLTDLYG